MNHGWQSEATDGPKGGWGLLSFSLFLSLSLSVYLYIYLSIYHYLSLSLSFSLFLSVCLSIYLSASLKTKLFCETSSVFKLDNIKKHSNSARLPRFLRLTTSKTKQFCQTSFFLKLTTSKAKQFCETSFKNRKLSAKLTASYQCVLRFFQSICLNYCACQEKVMPCRTKCCTCHAKSSLQILKIWGLISTPSQEISARTS